MSRTHMVGKPEGAGRVLCGCVQWESQRHWQSMETKACVGAEWRDAVAVEFRHTHTRAHKKRNNCQGRSGRQTSTRCVCVCMYVGGNLSSSLG